MLGNRQGLHTNTAMEQVGFNIGCIYKSCRLPPVHVLQATYAGGGLVYLHGNYSDKC